MTNLKVLYSAKQIARRVRQLGKQISRDFRGETLDLVCLVDTGHVFLADLMRSISVPVRVHFVSMEERDVIDPNYNRERHELFFYPEVEGEGRALLVVEGVLQTGVTLDYLLRRLSRHEPKALKTVVLLDKVDQRRVPVKVDYVGFSVASNDIVEGYGLAWNGLNANLPYLASRSGNRRGMAGRAAGKKIPAGRKRPTKKRTKKRR